jgi:hypothetical protein
MYVVYMDGMLPHATYVENECLHMRSSLLWECLQSEAKPGGSHLACYMFSYMTYLYLYEKHRVYELYHQIKHQFERVK